ncbi:MAG: hypothetical protein OXU73_01125 [Candidatus Campbellbacteria bacterium]|nr:hypothetical protein [Candidatus Campbellbacteria bacterium]
MNNFLRVVIVVVVLVLIYFAFGNSSTSAKGHYVLSIADEGIEDIERFAVVGFSKRPKVNFLIDAEVLQNAFVDDNSVSRHKFQEDANERGVDTDLEFRLRGNSALLVVFEKSDGEYYMSYINSLPRIFSKDGVIVPELERTIYFTPVSLGGEALEGVSVGIGSVGHTNEHHRTFSF